MKKRIVFMGTPEFACIVLKGLIESGEIELLALFCQPDRPFGRKKELKAPETKSYVENLGKNIPIFQPESFDETCVREIKNLKADMVVVVAYGQILPESLLDLDCINLHASLLPKYRGASPIQEMILNDEEFFGISAMCVRKGLDCGEILGIRAFRNDDEILLLDLSKKLASMGVELLLDIFKTRICLLPQMHAVASFCKKIKKQEGLVDFSDAKKMVLKARAYDGWPGVFLDSGLKLFDIKLEAKRGEAGKILEIDELGIVVACACGQAVRIGQIQAPGKQVLNAHIYAHGQNLKIGHTLQ